MNSDDGVHIFHNRMELDGVAVMSVSDGHVLGFKTTRLREALEVAERNGQHSLIIFVKKGPSIDAPEVNQ